MTPADVAVVLGAASRDRQSRAKAATMPDAVYDAALQFARDRGLIVQIGQLARVTHAGRTYLRRNRKAIIGWL